MTQGTWRSVGRAAALTGLLAAGCSGGGGEGGGDGRTTDTGIRVLHGAADIEPVDLRVGELLLQRAHFGDVTEYVKAEQGPAALVLDRANAAGTTVASLNADLQKKVEYSLLLFGRETSGTFSVRLLEDPVLRPETGTARLQIVNALEGAPPVRAVAGTVQTAPAAFSLASGFVDVPPGPASIAVKNEKGGTLLTLAVDIPDRSEATVFVTGVTDLNVIVGRVILDLD